MECPRTHGDVDDAARVRLILLLCTLAVAAIVPFSLYRFHTGDLLAGGVDLTLALGMAVIGLIVARGGPVNVCALAIAVFYTGGCLLMIHLRGEAVVYWLFPVCIGNFFVLRAWNASLLNGIVVLLVAPSLTTFGTAAQAMALLTNLLLVNLLSFVFSLRTERQSGRLLMLATRDPLTGVGNRRALEARAEALLHDAGRRQAGAALIILDLDRFKQVNDEHGHHVGDGLLVDLVRIIQPRIRERDALFRYGGEEFILLLPHAGVEEAANLAEKLRHHIERALGPEIGGVTASFGCAEPRPGEAWESWLARADEALYRAKDAGRNRVVVAD